MVLDLGSQTVETAGEVECSQTVKTAEEVECKEVRNGQQEDDARERTKRAAELFAGGGWNGVAPVSSLLPGQWKVGMPCHWQETSQGNARKHMLLRVAHVLHIVASIVYLQYRARKTLGIVTKHPLHIAYHILFILFELVHALSLIVHTFEIWRVVRRNAVDFKRIPNKALSTPFTHPRKLSLAEKFSNWPTVAIYIPCYNEDVGLVRQTVIGALGIDYPKDLLQIYLCDDGKDGGKLDMISALRRESGCSNLHYFIRPDNSHAKAGNLNYALSRTESDLIVTLDADFVSRPNLLQRLVPYYYNWNLERSLYEFNSSLACVQTPQHFRNLSPYDTDSTDQRSTLFTDVVLPGKDWFNASTMVGTTNLLGRMPAKDVGYYPCYSVTEDTAMSLAFHSAGYRTYYCNESLAHGLACTNLWSNIGQRARWMKGDWQILFHLTKSPLLVKGLSFTQRLCYLGMSLLRITSVANVGYEIGLVLLLVFSISPLDVLNPKEFMYYFLPYSLLGLISRSILVSGGKGLDKSESGSVAFEALFRFHVITGLFVTITSLLRGKNLKFDVTEKAKVEEPIKIGQDITTTLAGLSLHMTQGERNSVTQTDGNSSSAIISEGSDALFHSLEGNSDDSRTSVGNEESSLSRSMESSAESTEGKYSRKAESFKPRSMFYFNLSPAEKNLRWRDMRKSLEKLWFSVLMSARSTEGKDSRKAESLKPRSMFYFHLSSAEKRVRRRDMRKNLGKLWFSVLMAAVLICSVVWGVMHPPSLTLKHLTIDGIDYNMRYTSVLPVTLALGFACMNILCYLVAITLIFTPYTKGWMMKDFVHDRCDQYAVYPDGPQAGRPFVPESLISLLSVGRGLLLLGSLTSLAYSVYGPGGGTVLEMVV